ncbi:site-specific DNA-methyltransferase [Segatella baroniae]|uniref:site-specific DNA-methyltransferase n=1 Tax=Segatella baroniae TaxID=305719 RepID=UPI00040E5C97|nr:site-specific DNA-methyltransferase [Segatella baroniae]
MDKLNMQTTNIVDENIKRIGELFPNCLTERLNAEGRPEVAIDFDQLRQELSKDIVEGAEERYQFTWPDKRNAIRLANVPTTDTLRPCREESVDFDNTQNLYIEGDNLQVLKLLRENYLGKVKMIYIDPPYNTGNDFIYNDDFSQSAGEYMHNSGQEDEEGNRLVANTESNGRFHTDWLNMIYPRLKVAKDLLSMNGVIFISIDDGELDNLRKVCNEIFGESNFVADVAVVNNLKGRNDKKYIARANERLLMYVRSLEFEEYGLSLDEKVVSDYKEKDSKGNYRLLELRKRGGADTREERPNMYYPFFVNPEDGTVRLEKDDTHYLEALPVKSDGVDGRWRWGKETALKNIDYVLGKQVQGKERYNIYEKDYLEDENGQRRIRPKSVMSGASYSTDGATKEYRALMKPLEFDSPKPVALLRDLVEYANSPNDDSIILDFFSGSATTAHAVMQLNAEDGGKRKFIMVQLPEATDEKSEAYKAGYKNICEIGKERIRRAGKKIKEDSPLTTQDLDTGFRVLKLDSSNMQDVYYTPAEFNDRDLFEENIKPDRTDEDLLFQCMIELGIELSAKIEKKSIAEKSVWSVSDGYLMACFDKEVNETTITEIARQQPYYFVMRDSSLANDQVADNFEQIFNHYSKDTIRRIL